MEARRGNFRYLNREGQWLDFLWSGLEVSSGGALQLLTSPALSDQSAARPIADEAPQAPGGVAVDDTGRVFYSIPNENRVVARGGCDPLEQPLGCLTEGLGLEPLSAPRGLLVLRKPGRLVVADSGNDRLLFFDLKDFVLREVRGMTDLAAWPEKANSPSRFRKPWALAADEDDSDLYVLDAGNRRVLKFARTGEPDAAFLNRVRQSGLLSRPGALAVSGRGDAARVFVSDLDANVIYVFKASGEPVLDYNGWPVTISRPGMGNVLALATSETRLYVGDNDGLRILAFVMFDDYPFSGEAARFRGHVTALAVDAHAGALLVQTEGSPQPLRLELTGAYLGSGVLWSKAITAGPPPVNWHRLRASVSKMAGAHVEFYYAISDLATRPSPDIAAENPFNAADWHALPRDVEDFLLAGAAGAYLYVGARFLSDRTGTPRLMQMRADFDAESYTQYLPAIYREPSQQAQFIRGDASKAFLADAQRVTFLKRVLSLFQGLFEDIEDEADALEHYFDAHAVPPDALAWLATWLAVEIEQGEPEARIRDNIASAFQRYRWRGTVEGLRLALLEEAGVHAVITEPISAATFLAMTGGGGAPTTAAPQLGLGTHLTAMEPGGAVLGGTDVLSTAVLNRSYLITDAQFGRPLFDESAWQFVVEVLRGEVGTEAKLRAVREIIEREKPAHTMYRLEVIDSALRVGAQARVGVDTLVAGTHGPTPLGHGRERNGLRLGGNATPRVGVSRLGDDLKLSS